MLNGVALNLIDSLEAWAFSRKGMIAVDFCHLVLSRVPMKRQRSAHVK